MIAMILMSACAKSGSPGGLDLDEVDRVVYHFGDSSVPPEYHRSVTITVTSDKVHRVVDSYGDLVEERDRPGSRADLDAALQAFDAAGFKDRKHRNDRGCSGGTSESVSLYAGTEARFDATVYHCGGEDFGTLSGDIEGFAKAMEKLAT